LVAAIEIDFQ